MKKFSFSINQKGVFLLSLMCLTYQPLIAHTTEEKPHEHHHSMKHAQQPPTVRFTIEKIVDDGGKKVVFFKLMDSKSNNPIRLADLKEVHTQKIHLLIIDNTLTDYSHVHPQPTSEPGVYRFQWQPTHKNSAYRAWADLVPIHTNKQQYVTADLLPGKSSTTIKADNKLSYESTINGYQFHLSFDAPLKVGKAAMGKITVTDSESKPIHTLEPIMGAFAHIVGFNNDLQTVVHIHPMGTEPNSEAARGGPELQFHIEPEKTGFTKVFAQVKINGQELYAPFGIFVENNKS
ncbi:hypothetical protein [Legionella hackeliae]|uniref:Secreted protein n=1 Tax=Legionella hackeliae TaxID=449 RepID=A0A0A8UQ91_LEGHA|nr:hypothetical protein [Legionella hackeliae]KTD10157.1 hypothetical protein Lhac_2525 [Legionella hackeliae]CEK09651.1 conserved exported protein of unknown function [Legionella hackeliae]STX49562.1 secreted protein [Legionella hackeliae]